MPSSRAGTDKVAELKSHKPSRGGTGGSQTNLHRGKYRPESFIIPGQDQNGNSIRVYCRVVPLLDRAMDVITFSRKFPFKSKGDLMRWCIKVGVDRLEDLEPMNGSVIAQVDAMLSILRDEQANHAYLTLFNTMAETVAMHVGAQAMGEARRVVAMMKAQILKMDDGYWRDRYLKELTSKFGHLLDAKGASLGDHVDGPDNHDDYEEE